MVQIARAVRLKAKIIIFDEPTATLTPEEKHHLFALIDRLRRDQVSVIFISHALEEALEISDRITILRDGAHIITAEAKNFSRETIIRHMVGRSLTDELYRPAAEARVMRRPGEKILSVQNLSMQNVVRNTSFSIFAGQITGIFGLVGSGRTETAKIVAGVAKRDLFHRGDIRFEGLRGRRSVTASSMLLRTAKSRASSRRCRSLRTSTLGRFQVSSHDESRQACARCASLPPAGRRLSNLQKMGAEACRDCLTFRLSHP
jgi:ABC-type sugar transport system ATPase subunit